MRRYLGYILLILLAFSACSKNKTELSTAEKLARADELYASKKYTKAALLYDEISFERKSASTAYATLRLADSYYAVNNDVAYYYYITVSDSYHNESEVSSPAFFYHSDTIK